MKVPNVPANIITLGIFNILTGFGMGITSSETKSDVVEYEEDEIEIN